MFITIVFQTGTLTEDGLHFFGILPYGGLQFVTNIYNNLVKDLSQIDIRSPIMATMATCHSLTHINGSLAGDPLDLSMFKATDWVNNLNNQLLYNKIELFYKTTNIHH